MHRTTILPIIAIAAITAACTDGTGGGTPGGATSPPAARSVTVQLNAVGGSGVSGSATLTEEGTSTLVEVKVSDGGNQSMPAHIHPGTCAELDPKPRYPLSDVVNGASKTTVSAPLKDLQAGDFAVNLHKSATDITTYTACGEIPGS
ncbi:MAG TPA: hypothetical protein VFK38_08415 [Candidatus Limnocylindrales bacterium]|nr:hypothetical protein [Candidatus Limnocylindrales bacterium]